MHVIFYFPSEAPRGHDRKRARDEIMSILRRIDRISPAAHYVYEPPDDCPTLRALGVTWNVRPLAGGDTKVQFRPSLTISDASRAAEAAPVILANKKAKYPDYSDNGTVDVWLAVFIVGWNLRRRTDGHPNAGRKRRSVGSVAFRPVNDCESRSWHNDRPRPSETSSIREPERLPPACA